MSNANFWNRLFVVTAASPGPSFADFRHVRGSSMRIGRTPRFLLSFHWQTGAGFFGVVALMAALALTPACGQDSPEETADAAAATPAAVSTSPVAKPDLAPAAAAEASGTAKADPEETEAADPSNAAVPDPAADTKADPAGAAKADQPADTTPLRPGSVTARKGGPALKGKSRAPYVSPTKFVPSQLKGLEGECDNLMRLAAVLKAEVDRTTVDVLSVGVVRDASRIEQLAHKMRDERGSQ